MKIFLSHSSNHKPLVREVKRYLPEHINLWLDEKDLLIGDKLETSIQNAIEYVSDFVVIFLDGASISSEWVKKELEWALQKEKELDRTFVLPILLEKNSWERIEPKEFCSRKYLACFDYSESNIRELSNNLISELFALLSREIDRKSFDVSRNTNPVLQLLDEADTFISKIADEIRVIVFPYRKNKPLDIFELFKGLNSHEIMGSLNQTQFNDLLLRLKNQGFLSGLIFNGRHIYIDEEHYSWKTNMFIEGKKKIANKAISYIKSGDIIALDAGSTTLELAKHISQGLRMRIWQDLKVVTNSIPAANELLTTTSELGFDDDNNPLSVYIVGGRIRPNTLAVVILDEEQNETEFISVLDKLGGADVCFIGANGIDKENHFTTHKNLESKNKSDILKMSQKKIILADSSKFNISEEIQFASFDDDITIITNNSSPLLDGYIDHLKVFKTNLLIV